MEQSRKMAKIAYEALDEKKGEDIKIIDISGISVLADYFVIANGSNDSQVRALVDNVEEQLSKEQFWLIGEEFSMTPIKVRNLLIKQSVVCCQSRKKYKCRPIFIYYMDPIMNIT